MTWCGQSVSAKTESLHLMSTCMWNAADLRCHFSLGSSFSHITTVIPLSFRKSVTSSAVLSLCKRLAKTCQTFSLFSLFVSIDEVRIQASLLAVPRINLRSFLLVLFFHSVLLFSWATSDAQCRIGKTIWKSLIVFSRNLTRSTIWIDKYVKIDPLYTILAEIHCCRLPTMLAIVAVVGVRNSFRSYWNRNAAFKYHSCFGG